MFMFTTSVNIQIAQQLCSQTIFRKHTLYYSLQQFFFTVRFLHQLGRSHFSLTTGITCIAQVNLVVPLVSGKFHFVCINDNNIITAVSMRGKVWFVLSSQQFRNFRTETAYDLIGCIDNNPFFMSCFFVCRNGLVT